MLRALVHFALLGLALADGYGNLVQETCVPRLFTTTVTQTRVSTSYLTVTDYDQRDFVTNLEITSYDVRTVPRTSYVTVVQTAAPLVSTVTSFVTAPIYRTSEVLLYNTVYVTRSKEDVVTEIETTTRHVTQTGIDVTTVTFDKTIGRKSSAFFDRGVTKTVARVVTTTVFRNVKLTKTSFVRTPLLQQSIVTTFVTSPIEVTTTTTKIQYITSCYLPKVTYDH
ncbi:uncharacterized protein [Macrobrachium rosenbergii]|uniref:uncharacterized protein n=1 Tax=Macrobrachium rosenbergii TaxID=79674 RepID=UPI0034D65CB8